MKLSEVKVLDDGNVYLDGGWVLEYDAPHSRLSSQIWVVKQLMSDEEYAEAAILPGLTSDEVIFRVIPLDGDINAVSTRYRPVSEKQKIDAFYKWVEQKLMMHQVDEGFRRGGGWDKRPVWLVRLNKDGKESRMNDAKMFFDTEEDAIKQHNAMVEYNPEKTIEHNLYSTGELGTFHFKLSGKHKQK